MKTSEQILAVAELLRKKSSECRARDPALSVSLRGYGRDLWKLSLDVERLERDNDTLRAVVNSR